MTFAPILPLFVLVFLCLAIVALLIWSFLRPLPGRWMRTMACLLVLIACLNPTVTTTDYRSQKDIAIVLVDRSSSQLIADRPEQTQKALDHIKMQADSFHDLELRIVEIAPDGREDKMGTRAFYALRQAISGIDPKRFAGSILISDGQIHDIQDAQGLSGPLHLLISGHKNDLDRRLQVMDAPKYGLIDKPLILRAQVLDNAISNPSAPLKAIMPDGSERILKSSPDGIYELSYTPKHAGPGVIVLETPLLENEISITNNKVALTINGVRDRLRVLLVSGLPHPGQRTWRNILRSDPSVDLVHFTILRPSEKEDFTPLNELSLIAFPVRELFEEKLNDFDLVIFDRYYKHNVLSDDYFRNIRDYVDKGGALLISTGPDFAGQRSLAQTALRDLLPALPTGQVQEDRPYALKRTPLGTRHPVSATLGDEKKRWGRWMRLIETTPQTGNVILESAENQPVLVVQRHKKGRVAMLLSDHVWLWARGFDGGGPHQDLVRHIVHWLMKEPDLEEERLTLGETENHELLIRKQSLSVTTPKVTLTHPDGHEENITLLPQGKGVSSTVLATPAPGVYKVEDAQQIAMITIGALNSKEFEDPRASEQVLTPVIDAMEGRRQWIEDGLPDLRRISPDAAKGSKGWIGLTENHAEAVIGIKSTALLPSWLMFLLASALWTWGWWRESR